MRTAVVGAGPVGTVCARALAERGEDVLLLDPDPGPRPDGSWRRAGVMQFSHPHFFRHQVRQVLEEHAPTMWRAVVAGGCVVNDPPGDLPRSVTTVSSRRSTFEAALRSQTVHPRISRVRGRVDGVGVEGGRVSGVRAGSHFYDADRVLVATGRSGRLTDGWRPAAEGAPCGQVYASRTYRVRPGVEPLRSWTPVEARHDGYLAVAFPHDAGTLSALVLRPAHDAGWDRMLDEDGFQAVVSRIPVLAPWTDPGRSEPVTPVLRGGTLANRYRGQGSPPAGVLCLGDAVCTTNPSAARGVALGMLQAAALLSVLAQHHDDADSLAAFDTWCHDEVRPWFEDQLAVDASTLRRHQHAPLDPDGEITSDLVTSAAADDPSLAEQALLYQGMVAPPASLRPLHPRVRAMLRLGWRPRVEPGPTRDELVDELAALGAPGVPGPGGGRTVGAA